MKKLSTSELNRLSIEEFKSSTKNPIVVVLDNVRSAHNVGAFFRTSDAFLIEKIYLCGITAQPPHKEINKAALGATESVSWEHADKTEAVVMKLKETGCKVIVVEQTNHSTRLQELRLKRGCKYAFVFGNEVFGVEQKVVELADEAIEIPQFGSKHSFNVSVSGGIVLWEAIRNLKFNR